LREQRDADPDRLRRREAGDAFVDQVHLRVRVVHEHRLDLLRPALQAPGFEREAWIAGAMMAFMALTAWNLSQLFSGRAMYIQIGAMLRADHCDEGDADRQSHRHD
jgi:hypothetical protein